MKLITVPGARLAYDEAGTGAPVVLVHGTGAQASTWGGTVEDLAAGGYRVIAYDRRGYGRSEHRPVRDYRTHVTDLAAVVEAVAAEHGGRAHIVGWSSGGNTALALGVAHPELCRSLVIVEAPWHGLRGATPDLLATLGRAKVAQLRGRRREATAMFFRWAAWLRGGGNGFDAAPPAEQEELLGNSASVLAELDPHPFGLMMEHIPTAKLAAIPVPITWLLGTESRDWFGTLYGRVARQVPGIRCERIEGAGHLTHIDAPEAFAAAVLDAVRAS